MYAGVEHLVACNLRNRRRAPERVFRWRQTGVNIPQKGQTYGVDEG
jgi:hypothetical protein